MTDIPLPKGEDAQYLARTIGDTLASALARVSVVQPNDPVDWLGRLILSECAAEKRRARRDGEAALLKDQGAAAAEEAVRERMEEVKRGKGRNCRGAARYVAALEARRGKVRLAIARRVVRERRQQHPGSYQTAKPSSNGEDSDEDEAEAKRRRTREAALDAAEEEAALKALDAREVHRAVLASIAADLAGCVDAIPAADVKGAVFGEAVTRSIGRPARPAALTEQPVATPRQGQQQQAKSEQQGKPVIDDPNTAWVGKVEAWSHDPADYVAIDGKEAGGAEPTVDESHALFKIVRAILLLLGYPESAVGNWDAVRAVITEGYFLKQFELYTPDAAADLATIGERVTKCASAISGIDLSQLHSSHLVGTVLLEYAREAMKLVEAATEGTISAQVQGGESSESIGRGVVQADARADTAAIAKSGSAGSASGQVLGALPGLNACIIDKTSAAQPVELKVSWAYIPEPVAPTPPEDASGKGSRKRDADDSDAGSDADSDSDSDSGDRRKKSKKGGKSKRSSSRSKGRSSKKRPSSSKKNRRRADSSEEEDSDDEGSDNAENVQGPRWEPEIDVACMMFDSRGNATDGAYFDQLVSRDGSVSLTEYCKTLRGASKKTVYVKGRKVKVKSDETESATPANTEVFSIDLPRVPPTVHCIVFTAGCNVPGETMEHVSTVTATLAPKGAAAAAAAAAAATAAGGTAPPPPPALASLSYPARFSNPLSLVCMLHRLDSDEDTWCLRAIADPVSPSDNKAGCYHTLAVPSARAYLDTFGIGCYDGAVEDALHDEKQQQHAQDAHHQQQQLQDQQKQKSAQKGMCYRATTSSRFALSRGSAFELTVDDLSVGFGWSQRAHSQQQGHRGEPPAAVEAEASLVCFDSGEVADTISADNASSADGAINHAGDENRDGSVRPGADNESASIILSSVDKGTGCIVLALSVPDDETSVRDLAGAYVRLVDNETSREVARFTLGDTDALGTSAASWSDLSATADTGTVVLGKLQRSSRRGWEFVAAGVISEGRSASDATDEVEAVASLSWAIPADLHRGVPHAIGADNAAVSISWASAERFAGVDLYALVFQEGRHADTVTAEKLKSNDKAIVHQGDDREALLPGEAARVVINFNKMNERVEAVVLAAVAREHASGATLGAVDTLKMSLFEDEAQRNTAQFIVRPGEGANSAAISLAKIVRASNGSWQIAAVGEPHPGAGAADEVAAASSAVVPARWVPAERLIRGVPFVLRKGKCTFGFGWETVPGAEAIDVDASAWLFSGSQAVETVTYQTQMSTDGAVVHAGDNRGGAVGAGMGTDREKIRLNLEDLRPDVDSVVFFLHVYDEKHSFLDIERGHLRVCDETRGIDIAKFSIGGDSKKTHACLMVKLQWRGDAWILVPIGEHQKNPDPTDIRILNYLKLAWAPTPEI